jgi:hypothetical protein
MRLLRSLLNLIAAAIAAALTVAAVIYFVPGLQRSLLLTQLERDTERRYAIGSIHVQATSVALDDVFVLDRGQGLEIGQARLTGPFWRLPLDRHLTITGGELRGVVLDLTSAPSDIDGTVLHFLEQADALDKERWLSSQVARGLAPLRAAGLGYRIENLAVDARLDFPGFNVQGAFLIMSADSSDAAGIDLVVHELTARSALPGR